LDGINRIDRMDRKLGGPAIDLNGGRRSVVAMQTSGADGAAPSKSQHMMTTHLMNTTPESLVPEHDAPSWRIQ